MLIQLALGNAHPAFLSSAAEETPHAAAVFAAAAEASLPAEITALMESPRYRSARWGLHVADRASGEVIYDLNGGEMFITASTTKLFSGAAALDAYGPVYRFETPVYRGGAVDNQGELRGDLILVASGDMTMGGRDTPDGRIDFTSFDHIYANAAPLASLTPEDPLAGLNDLARQVAEAGIRRVSGNVIIDARLFPSMKKDEYILTPIWVNDNLIDLTIKPASVGQPAALESRPQTAAYQVESEVQTVAAGQPLGVTVESPRPGLIVVKGKIPVDQTQLVQTYQVEDPPAFARTLLIEALQRQGVVVAASPTGDNPAGQLPPTGSYRVDQRVAVHRSLPFAENIKLVLKVSHNQHADMLVFLLALKNGQTTFEAGMQQILPLVQAAGIDRDAVSLSDGRGGEYTDLFGPRTVTQLLRYMSTRADFPTYHDALPILGVDGTEADTVSTDSPVRGQAVAKSGMTVAGDAMHQRLVVMARALAGYMTTRSGREVVFATYLNYIPAAGLDDVQTVIKEQGGMLEAIFDHN